MTNRQKWPTEAKLTIAVLVVFVLVIAGIRGAVDDQRQSITAGSTQSQVVTTSASPTTTRPPTTPHPTRPSTASSTVAVTNTTATPAPPRQAPSTVPAPAPTPSPTLTPAPRSSVAAELDGLPSTTPDQTRAYKRAEDFGPAWTDDNDMVDGHNGCDTRNDILHRDLTNIEVRPGTHDCVVIAGTLNDPYSGTTMTFAKAQASQVQIDHLVPLHAAWELGAWQWSQQKRVNYANDPDVLLAVDGHLNEQKSDKLADGWKPPNVGYWCTYAIKTVTIHVKYELAVTSSERSALHEMLARC